MIFTVPKPGRAYIFGHIILDLIPPVMNRLLLLACLLMLLTINACRCANPPPVGPVEDARASVR